MRKVRFRQSDGFGEIAVTEDGKLERFYRLKEGFLTGSIFVGIIRRVSKNVGAFVDIGLDKDGLLSYRNGLKSGDCVTVAVTKEPTEEKGCALTENVTIPGRFAVVNGSGRMNFSRKISDEKREEITKTVRRGEGIGFVFRSLCEEADADKVAAECETLEKEYRKITAKASTTTKVTRLWTDDAPGVADRLCSCGEVSDDFTEIEDEIIELGQRKITVDGVEIVFDKTEALTAIDVNMHRFSRSYKDAETAVFEANRIAVREIARQIRLRNIGGIIMIDFISMKDKENLAKLKEILDEELAKDSVRTKSEIVESIGMFAVVRKKRFEEI